jgi:Calx-beta domain
LITLELAADSAAEDGSDKLVYIFRRTGLASSALRVNYTVGGTATLGTDYTGISSSGDVKTVTFAAGSATTTVIVDPRPDIRIEPDETVVLSLQAGMDYTIGSNTTATGTISNDDLPQITLALASRTVAEDGAANLIYTFQRTGPTTTDLSVNYTVAGTASLGTDYTGIADTHTTKTISFAAGSAAATLSVDPTPDSEIEPNETVALTLAAGAGYRIGTTTAVRGRIRNDDISSATSYRMKRADSNLTLTGANMIHGIGNSLGNRITGNSANNQIRGAAGKDILTGGGTADSDRFIFSRLSDSLLLEPISGTGGYFDEITDFNNKDRIVAPASVLTRRLTGSIGAVASIAPEAIAALLTSSAFAANTVVVFTANSHTGSFLALNDGRAGFQDASDAVVLLRNYSISAANPIEFI